MRYPVMRGIDAAGRPFIAFCYSAYGKEVVEVAFQRYSMEYKWNWVSGICCNSRNYIKTRSRLYGIDEVPDKQNDKIYSDDVKFMGDLIRNEARERRTVKKENGQVLDIDNEQSARLPLCSRR